VNCHKYFAGINHGITPMGKDETDCMYYGINSRSSLRRALGRSGICLIPAMLIFMCADTRWAAAYAAEQPVSLERAELSTTLDLISPSGSKTIRTPSLLQMGIRVDENIISGDNRTAINNAPEATRTDLSLVKRDDKSYLVPALEIPGFLTLLNLYDRQRFTNPDEYGNKVYNTSPATAWSNLRRQDWRFDSDPFNTNQFGHPYQGAMMYGFARSSGLNFWESLIYSNLGSFAWEMAGENQAPSINDQITTGNAGSLLGEALFRMSNLVLRDSSTPGFLRETGAMLISPTSEVNRLVFDKRFGTNLPAVPPATFWRVTLGTTLDTHRTDLLSIGTTNLKNNTTMEFFMAYGLPGKPGYSYVRPLDYFDFQLSALADSNNPVENVMLRGILLGRKYEVGQNFRGIWGLYGSYDYISPYLFRVSSTAASLGTTSQYWVAPGIALQNSVLGGLGFGAAGTQTVTNAAWKAGITRDYHYGITPQGLVSAALHCGDRAIFDVTSRGYYVGGHGSDDGSGSETIFRTNVGITFRVWGRHALGAQFTESTRIAKHNNIPARHQSEGTITLVYTYLGNARLGAVEWR
jgi:hypothetical protein